MVRRGSPPTKLQRYPVTRENQVRIVDLGVGLPDGGPLPGTGQKATGDIPQRVPLLNHVFARMIFAQLDILSLYTSHKAQNCNNDQ